MNSELIHAIKREIYHELENILADAFFGSFFQNSVRVKKDLEKQEKLDFGIFGIKI